MGSEEVVSVQPFIVSGKVEHPSRAEAETFIASEFEKAKTEALKRGCEIDENGFIIPINAQTGRPDYEAQRTTKWAEVEEDSGKFYVKTFESAISITPEPEVVE